MSRSSVSTPTRRTLISAFAGAAACCAAPRLFAQSGSGAATLRIAQTAALTGPLAELGQAMHTGARACFEAVNARGGVNDQRIELVSRDDGYDTQRALDNVRGFLADGSVFALFNCMGTPMVEAMLPLLREHPDMPLFAPFSGALSVRPRDMHNVFNVRASYPEETEQLVQHLATIGMRRIAVAHQNNSFGKEVLAAAQAACSQRGLAPVVVAAVENDASDAHGAAEAIVAAQPEAVLLGLAGKPTIAVVKELRAMRRGLPLYALSVMGSAATLKALGDDAKGITVSQVMPLPSKSVTPMVLEFQQGWRAVAPDQEPSHLALEGYVNARVFVEALRRAGRNPTRKAFIQAVWNLKRYDLGGFEVGFSQPGRNASRFVELTMVTNGGRFLR